VVVSCATQGEINNTQAKMVFGSKKGKAWNGLGSSLRFRSGWNGHHGAGKKVPNQAVHEADSLMFFFFKCKIPKLSTGDRWAFFFGKENNNLGIMVTAKVDENLRAESKQ